jgi:heat shock protein HslJ
MKTHKREYEMLKSMYFKILLGVILISGLVRCTSSGSGLSGESLNQANDPPRASVDSSWSLFAYRKTRLIEGTSFTIQFESGQVRGNAGCNQFFGSYTIEADQITLSDLGMTEMACMEPEGLMEQEQYLLRFLAACETVKFSDDNLFLTRSGGEQLSFTPLE